MDTNEKPKQINNKTIDKFYQKKANRHIMDRFLAFIAVCEYQSGIELNPSVYEGEYLLLLNVMSKDNQICFRLLHKKKSGEIYFQIRLRKHTSFEDNRLNYYRQNSLQGMFVIIPYQKETEHLMLDVIRLELC